MGERLELSLYKIADVLNVPMVVKGKHITGSATAMWDLGVGGLHLPIEIVAHKMVCGEQVAVLFHISGDLWVLVAHNPAKGALSLFLVDGAKCEMEGLTVPPDLLLSSSMTLREAVDALHPAVAKAWVWKKMTNEWASFPIPAPVS